LTIFIRQVKEHELNIDYTPNSVAVTVQLPSGGEYNLDIDLCDAIVPSSCSHTISPTKVEVRLVKKSPSHWPTLEKKEGVEAQGWASINNSMDTVPEYPTSSKNKKNWDKLAKEADKDDGEKSLNQVFEGIFKGADDEQRLAMQKSFFESGGTVLSTNWSEVGKGKVQGSAPKGMEMRNWKDDALVPESKDSKY